MTNYTPELLHRLYIEERLSTTEIAKQLGLSNGAGGIYRALKRYGIPTRSKADSVAISWEKAPDERRIAAGENIGKQARENYAAGVATRAKQYREKPTPSEKLVIDMFTEMGEPFEFQVQFGIYIADFVLPNRGLVLEIDSLHHRTKSISDRDSIRDALIAGHGYRTVRVSYWTSSKAKRARFLSEVREAITLPAS